MGSHANDFQPFIDVAAQGQAEVRRGGRKSRAPAASGGGVVAEATGEESKSSFEAYLSRMSQDREWGDNLELSAVAKAFGVDIGVYEPGGDDLTLWRRVVVCGVSGAPLARIAFHNWRHYSSVRPQNSTFVVLRNAYVAAGVKQPTRHRHLSRKDRRKRKFAARYEQILQRESRLGVKDRAALVWIRKSMFM